MEKYTNLINYSSITELDKITEEIILIKEEKKCLETNTYNLDVKNKSLYEISRNNPE